MKTSWTLKFYSVALIEYMEAAIQGESASHISIGNLILSWKVDSYEMQSEYLQWFSKLTNLYMGGRNAKMHMMEKLWTLKLSEVNLSLAVGEYQVSFLCSSSLSLRRPCLKWESWARDKIQSSENRSQLEGWVAGCLSFPGKYLNRILANTLDKLI